VDSDLEVEPPVEAAIAEEETKAEGDAVEEVKDEDAKEGEEVKEGEDDVRKPEEEKK